MKISITKGEAEKLLAIFEEPAANLTWPTDYRLHGADARALAALARLGASVAFESEDTVEKVARQIYALAPPFEWIETSPSSGHSGAAISFDDERSGSYRKTAERHARAAIAALRDSPVSARLAARQPS